MEKKLAKQPDILAIVAAKNNLDPTQFLNTIKSTIMKPGKDGRIASNEEIAAFLIVANKYHLDPFTNEIYAFPSKKGGIIPVVGVDGFVSLMNRNKDFNGMDITFSDDEVTIEGAKPCPQWCEVKIYKKSIDKPIVAREYLDECYCPPKGGYPGPWQSHTKRMLRHKTIIQGGRIAFGITGLYDPDEADRIMETEGLLTMKPPVDMPEAIAEQIIEPATAIEPAAKEPAKEEKTAQPQKPAYVITEPQSKRLFAIAKSMGWTDVDIHEYIEDNYGITTTRDIQREHYEDICLHFQTPKNKDE